MTKTTGSLQTAARFRVSWNAPMFAAPSPKKQTLTAPVSGSCAAHAAPALIGRWAPTMAKEPSAPTLDVGQVHRAALAAAQAVRLAEDLTERLVERARPSRARCRARDRCR